jgi:hypothetical protein
MTVTPLRRVPLASVQGTLALDLVPRHAPPAPAGPRGRRPQGVLADVVPLDPPQRDRLDQWVHRFVQATVEIVGGDRPVSQLLRWTSRAVHDDLHRRAVLVARAGGHAPGVARVQPVRPHVVSVHTSLVTPRVAEASARVRYGGRSRAVALRFERRDDAPEEHWVCTALEFA